MYLPSSSLTFFWDRLYFTAQIVGGQRVGGVTLSDRLNKPKPCRGHRCLTFPPVHGIHSYPQEQSMRSARRLSLLMARHTLETTRPASEVRGKLLVHCITEALFLVVRYMPVPSKLSSTRYVFCGTVRFSYIRRCALKNRNDVPEP